MLVSTRANPIEPDQTTAAEKRTRRGTTLMEYLMMISLILTVCLVGIGYFGSKTNDMATSAAKAINKSMKGS